MADVFYHAPYGRRQAMAALGATGLAGIALAGFARPETLSPHPASLDSALLSLAAAYRAVERERDNLADRWGDTLNIPQHAEAEMSSLQDEAVALQERIAATPSRTAAGIAAKGRIAAELIAAFGVAEVTATDRLVLSLCRDVGEAA